MVEFENNLVGHSQSSYIRTEVKCGHKETENDAPNCFQISPYLIALFWLRK